MESIDGDRHLLASMISLVLMILLNHTPLQFVTNVILLAIEPSMMLNKV